MLEQGRVTSSNGNLIPDPIALFTQELKDKNIKKQALEEIGTIAIVLSSVRIKQQLIPLLTSTFVQETLQIRVLIIKSVAILLQYLQKGNQSFTLLEFILDILCAFSEVQLRKQAFIALEKIIDSLNIRKYQGQLIKVIKELMGQNQKNIRQLVLKLVRYVYIVAENQNQSFLLLVLNSYKLNEESQILLADQISQFIKIMPPFPQSQIHKLMKQLLQSPSSKVRSKLIQPIILLVKVLDEQSTQSYLQAIFNDKSTEVIASLILKIQKIKDLSSPVILNKVLQIVDKQQIHDSNIRASILQVLQHIPLTEQRRTYILNTNHFKSLSLSKALADSLCKIHDIEALSSLIQTSDMEFKNKLFPKLPSACEIHVKLMEHIFNQKNWRSKLTLLQNIEKRMQNDQNVQIFLPKLLQQLGDKIGALRIGVIRLLGLIIKTRKIELKQISKQLTLSISHKNWFERQSVILLLEQLADSYSSLSENDKNVFKKLIFQGFEDVVANIHNTAEGIKIKCKITF